MSTIAVSTPRTSTTADLFTQLGSGSGRTSPEPAGPSPDQLDLGTIVDIATGLASAEALWRPHVDHDPISRTSVRLVSTPVYEVWLLGWTPGQRVELHDHGGANAAFVVVDGELDELTLADGQVRSTHLRPDGQPRPAPGRPAVTTSRIDAHLAEVRAGLERVAPGAIAAELAAGALLVDLRPEANRQAEGQVPGAIAIERIHLEWRLDHTCGAALEGVDDDTRVVLFCNDGYSSSLAAADLQQLGLHRATDVDGGYRAWKRAGGQDGHHEP